MAGKLQRCYACNPHEPVEFEADKPECPKGHTYPAVLTLTLVHWLMPGGPIHGSEAMYHVACMPDRPSLANIVASGQPDAVICPKCKKVKGFAEALAAWREWNGQ